MECVSDNQELRCKGLSFEDDQRLGLIDIAQEDDDLLAYSPCFRSSADSRLSGTIDNTDENGSYNLLQHQFSQTIKHKAANLLQEEHEQQVAFVPESLSSGRPSLAWDNAFFTDEGVLDEDELTLMNEGLNATRMQPVAHKDVNKRRYSKTDDAFSPASRKINTSILNRTKKSTSERGSMNIQRSLENKTQIKTPSKREKYHPLSVKASKLSSPLVNLLTGKSRSESVDAYHAKKESRAGTLLSVDKLKLRKKSGFGNSGRLSSASSVAFGSSVFPRSSKISTGSSYSQGAVIIKSEKGPNSSLDSQLINNVQTTCLQRKAEADSPAELMNYQSTPDAHQVLAESSEKIRSSHLRMPSPKIGFFDEGKLTRGSLQFQFETQRTLDCSASRKTSRHPRAGMSSETKPLKHPVQEIGHNRSDGKLRRYTPKPWGSGKTRQNFQSGVCGEEGEWICSKCQKVGSDVQDRKRVGKISALRQDNEKRTKGRLRSRVGRQIEAQSNVLTIAGERMRPAGKEQHKPDNLPSGNEDETGMLTDFENQVNDLSKYFEVIDLGKNMQIENQPENAHEKAYVDSTILSFTGENDTDHPNHETPKLFRNHSPSMIGPESSPSSSRTPLADKTSVSNRSGSISAKENSTFKSLTHACSGKENSFPRVT